MRTVLIATICVFVLILHAPVFASDNPQPAEGEQSYLEWAQSLWDSMDRQTGKIELPNGVATLDVPENFYYLNPEDTRKVLEQVWGNPPGAETLGMLFPSDYTPFHQEAWGVTIGYEEDGYVSDKDADKINYDDLLKDMKKSTAQNSKERVKKGYPAIELVGWAARPYYDKENKKLHWAKELEFGENPEHTLNYNIRVLGRKGVLVMNFVAGMNQLDEINANLSAVMAMADFNEGFRYADFNPEIDKVAAYGIGGLVAGKLLAKAGIFKAVILFAKKFGVIALIAIAALAKKLFGRRKATTSNDVETPAQSVQADTNPTP